MAKTQMGLLTCSGGQRGTFLWSGFVSAFDWKSWLGFVLSCLATIGFITCSNIYLVNQGESDCKMYWVPFLVLLEQGTHVNGSRM